MNSKCLIRASRSQNFGGRCLILQEQSKHREKLQGIYLSPTNAKKSPIIKRNPRASKQEIHEMTEHQRNIEHLYKFITRPKNMADRYKDPHDFFVYPALFRREIKSRKQNKKVQRVTSSKALRNSEPSEKSDLQRKFGIDSASVKQQLPLLQEFTREEIEEYADCLTRLIFNYNLSSQERLAFLKECAIKAIPVHYPPNFPEVVEEIFTEISDSLGI